MQIKDRYIVGIDEAGRGPLAGPVVAGAVILPPNCQIPYLTDSKKLSAKKRDELFLLIRQVSIAWAVGRASAREIDEINILQATFLAMHRAVKALKIIPTMALIDGNQCPNFTSISKRMQVQAIVQGDLTEPAISAASIVAKVFRDRFMDLLDRKYSVYGFQQHKGYPTAAHLAALKKHGPSRVHRKTFGPVKKCLTGL